MIRRVLLIAFALLLTTVEVNADGKPAGDSPNVRAGYRLAPKAFRAAAARVRPALVMIETYGGIGPPRKKTKRPRRGRKTMKPGDGPTTGLIVSRDGLIITSTFNFITRPPIITVVRQDGSRHVAKLLGRDNLRKICLLKVDGAKDWPTAEYIADEKLNVGQWAISVGLGYGKQPVISAGIIGAKNRIGGRAVQTDANISPENYGGPLVDIEGKVIGLCVPLNPRSRATSAGVEWYNSGIGFAIPLADAGRSIEAMKTGKTIQPAALGVRVKAVEGKPAGVDVQRVTRGSAADKGNLRTGDRIVSIDRHAVANPTQLRFRLARFMAGETVKVIVLRSGKRETLTVTLGVAAAPKVKAVPKRSIKRAKNPRK